MRSGRSTAQAARQLDVPTLILHSTNDLLWPFEEAEDLHAMVSGNKLVALDSRNHILSADEPAFGHFVGEIAHFLATVIPGSVVSSWFATPSPFRRAGAVRVQEWSCG